MKRIITCSDGTWNHPGEKFKGVEVKTNVRRIYEYIAAQDLTDPNRPIDQVKFYDAGVGTSKLKSVNIFQGITGEGLDKNIRDAYEFIARNYQPGDEIYLFGFSRGAYTARSVAGFIRNSGLLKQWDDDRAKEAFDLYRDRSDDTTPDSEQMVQFKKAFCHEPRIRLIGVWDTVGSLGIPLNWFQRWNHKRYSFHDVRLSRSVDFAYHALAIHERRNNFQPTLWELNPTPDPQFPQVLEQTWFSGVHSNIGGGYDDVGLSETTLKWMMCRAQVAGLEFKIDPMFIPNPKGKLQDSTTWYYKMLGIGWRTICENETKKEGVHPSVEERDIAELPSALRANYKKFLTKLEDWKNAVLTTS